MKKILFLGLFFGVALLNADSVPKKSTESVMLSEKIALKNIQQSIVYLIELDSQKSEKINNLEKEINRLESIVTSLNKKDDNTKVSLSDEEIMLNKKIKKFLGEKR